MFIGSPSLNSINNLIFGAGHDDNIERVNSENEPEHDGPDAANPDHGQGWPRKRESMYVTTFEREC
jgi:hypothetical protein